MAGLRRNRVDRRRRGLIFRPGRDDSAYRFEAHSEYFYLTDRNLPGGVLAFDPGEGWFDFVAPVTVSDRLWSGAPAGEADGPTTDDLEAWLRARSSRTVARLGSSPAGGETDNDIAQDLRYGLSRVRRIEVPVELSRMRTAQHATREALKVALPLIREGVSERELQIELEAEAFRHGAEAMAYDTIIGSGVNSGVLHFAPTDRRFRAGELVLIDAGAQYRGYASDNPPAPTRWAHSSAQSRRELHAVVRRAEQVAITQCRPGTEWRDVIS